MSKFWKYVGYFLAVCLGIIVFIALCLLPWILYWSLTVLFIVNIPYTLETLVAGWAFAFIVILFVHILRS